MFHEKIHALMVEFGMKRADFHEDNGTVWVYTWISDREYRFGERGAVPDVYWV